MQKFIFLFLFSGILFGGGGIEIGTGGATSSIAHPPQTTNISSESVFSNPSVTNFLDSGFSISGGLIIAFPKYTLEFKNNPFLKTESTQWIPSISTVYNKEKLGFYFAMGSLGQGGFLKYNVVYDRIQNLKVTSLNPGFIFGGTYRLRKNMSVSLGGRFLYSKIEGKGDIDTGQGFKSKITSKGIAPEISLFYKYNDKLSLGAKYLWRTKLNYKGHITTDDGNLAETLFAKFSKDHRKDFPAVFSIGASYKLNEKQKFSFTYNRIFESEKKADKNLYHKFKDTNEYLFGFETVLTTKINLLLGYSYVDKGKNGYPSGDITQLSSHTYSTGIRYKATDNTIITFALGLNKYESHKGNLYRYRIKTKRKEVVTGLSFEKKL